MFALAQLALQHVQQLHMLQLLHVASDYVASYCLALDEGEKVRWRQCTRPFLFVCFIPESRQTNARARRETKN